MDSKQLNIDIDAFLDPVFTLSLDGRIDRISSSCRVLLEQPPSELIGTHLSAFLHEDDKRCFEEIFARMSNSAKPTSTDLHIVVADRKIPVRLCLAPILVNNNLCGVQGQMHEIWEAEKYRKVLAERESNVSILEEIGEILNTVSGTEPSLELVLQAFLNLDNYECGGLYHLKSDRHFSKITESGSHADREQTLLPDQMELSDLPDDYLDRPRLIGSCSPGTPLPFMVNLNSQGLTNSVLVPIKFFGTVKAILILAGRGVQRVSSSINHMILSHCGDFIGQFIHTQELKEEITLHNNRFRDLIESSVDHIWEVDREGKYVYNSPNLTQVIGFTPEEVLGCRPSDYVHPEDREEVVTLLKQLQRDKQPLRGMVYRVLNADDKILYIESRAFPIFDEAGDVSGYRGVDRNISDWFEKQHILEETLIGTCEALSRMVELRDPYTKGHSVRVANLMMFIGGHLGRSPYELQGLRLMGLLHDIGKIGIPTEILSKPGKLTLEEMELMRLHPQMSYDILKDISFPWPVAKVVLQHHERLNGSGYPNGLDSDEIMWQVRLLAVADLLEAMSTNRPYRAGLGLDLAVKELELGRNVLFDNEIVNTIVRLHESGALAKHFDEAAAADAEILAGGRQPREAADPNYSEIGSKPMPDAAAAEEMAGLGQLLTELGNNT
ncbi:MAG: PAS domain S-box protein [bacterium]|nr:PAS domain S-box protein [bacterium]